MSPATKTPGIGGHEPVVARHVAAVVDLDAERVDQALALRAGEAHGEEDQVGRQLALGALDLLEPAVDPLHLVQQQRAEVAVLVAQEALGVDRVQPLAALLVGAGDPHDHRVGRPRVGVLGPAVRRAPA